MLEEDIKIEKQEKKEFPPIPKDIYQVELLDIGIQNIATYDTRLKDESEQVMEKVLTFQFTLLEGIDNQVSLRGRNIWANFIPSYLYISKRTGKNKLYRILEALLGRELTPKDEATLDKDFLNSLIGKQCRLSVEPTIKGDKHYDNPIDYLKANSLINALTADEKEEAKVKNKDKEKEDKKEEEMEVPDFLATK